MNFEVDKFSYEELNIIKDKIFLELKKRETKRKGELWNNFITAMNKYIEEFGSIEISSFDSYLYLDSRSDTDSFGRIDIKC